MRSLIPLISVILAFGLTACGAEEEASNESATPAAEAAPSEPEAAAETAPEAEAEAEQEAETAEAAGGGELTATAVEGPLEELDRDGLEAALEAGGWEIGSSTSTQSAMYAITTHATKNGVEAEINYYRDGGDFWRERLEESGAAIHADDEHEVLLGVTIESQPDAQQGLLDSLLPE
ncbi:MAG TPA: hypothetical protein RMH99_15415 [Sandaracinaceae bacterium LLY-WYZ-13_1]|nr:hypothetical protein [Sandaracinaceae bacterium LLY-WYZ-13_1]